MFLRFRRRGKQKAGFLKKDSLLIYFLNNRHSFWMEESSSDITTYFVPICFFPKYFVLSLQNKHVWEMSLYMEQSLHRSPFQWNKNRNTHTSQKHFLQAPFERDGRTWTLRHSSFGNIFQLRVKTSKYRLRRPLDWACHFDSYRLWENSNLKLCYNLYKSKKLIFVLFKILCGFFAHLLLTCERKSKSFRNKWPKKAH